MMINQWLMNNIRIVKRNKEFSHLFFVDVVLLLFFLFFNVLVLLFVCVRGVYVSENRRERGKNCILSWFLYWAILLPWEENWAGREKFVFNNCLDMKRNDQILNLKIFYECVWHHLRQMIERKRNWSKRLSKL